MKNLKTIFTLTICLLIFKTGFSQITEIGLASFYADKFDGRITASGEIFDQKKMTAAHRTLPFGTKVKVTRLDNNTTAFVVINDRGPFIDNRVIDLSRSAAEKLDFINSGVCKVKVEVLSMGGTTASKAKPTPKPTPKPKAKPAVTPVPAEGNASTSDTHENSYYTIESTLIQKEGFGVQVASYKEAANLMQRCNEIKQKTDKNVIVQVGESRGDKVYRIILGPFSDKESAQKYKESVSTKFNGCFVVPIK